MKISDNPGPDSYNVDKSQQFLKVSHAVRIGARPWNRMTDEIINASRRERIPGPGSYNILKTPQRPRTTTSCTFGTTGESFLNVKSKLFIPGPGAYHPEVNALNKVM